MCDNIRNILFEQVQIAFTTTEYPGDDNIVYDIYSHYSDVIETLNSFKGKHWSELTPDVVLLNSSHLAFLTTQAFCFYLPTYLLTIASYTGYIDQLLETVLFYLTPPEPGSQDMESFLRRVECFNTQQREVIRTLLSLFVCVTYGSENGKAYQADLDLMRAVTFWGYKENSVNHRFGESIDKGAIPAKV
jgi:uncharacterized protein DUF6714